MPINMPPISNIGSFKPRIFRFNPEKAGQLPRPPYKVPVYPGSPMYFQYTRGIPLKGSKAREVFYELGGESTIWYDFKFWEKDGFSIEGGNKMPARLVLNLDEWAQIKGRPELPFWVDPTKFRAGEPLTPELLWQIGLCRLLGNRNDAPVIEPSEKAAQEGGKQLVKLIPYLPPDEILVRVAEHFAFYSGNVQPDYSFLAHASFETGTLQGSQPNQTYFMKHLGDYLSRTPLARFLHEVTNHESRTAYQSAVEFESWTNCIRPVTVSRQRLEKIFSRDDELKDLFRKALFEAGYIDKEGRLLPAFDSVTTADHLQVFSCLGGRAVNHQKLFEFLQSIIAEKETQIAQFGKVD